MQASSYFVVNSLALAFRLDNLQHAYEQFSAWHYCRMGKPQAVGYKFKRGHRKLVRAFVSACANQIHHKQTLFHDAPFF